MLRFSVGLPVSNDMTKKIPTENFWLVSDVVQLTTETSHHSRVFGSSIFWSISETLLV